MTSRSIALLQPPRGDMEEVERLLHETLSAAGEPLSSALRPLLDGGKRLRPALVILTAYLFDRRPRPFYRLAAAVELLHTATLIHDDVVDDADLRRGRATLHSVWPRRATVLAGDYLLAQSVSLAAALNEPRVVGVLAETLRTMSSGEIRQLFASRRQDSRRRQYYRSIDAKSASLFAAATTMAGILAGADEPGIAALQRFGWELGMAFQIVDDVLDFVGTDEQLGKPAGSDLRQGLLTLPTLYYLERVEKEIVVGSVLAGERDEAHLRSAMEAVISSGAIEASLSEAEAYIERSVEALSVLPDNDARQRMAALARHTLERKH